jgi:hypothetical protein
MSPGAVASEAWMRPSDVFVFPSAAGARRGISIESLPLAAGFSRSVFRPPRG